MKCFIQVFSLTMLLLTSCNNSTISAKDKRANDPAAEQVRRPAQLKDSDARFSPPLPATEHEEDL